jgi:hypothetical protein
LSQQQKQHLDFVIEAKKDVKKFEEQHEANSHEARNTLAHDYLQEIARLKSVGEKNHEKVVKGYDLKLQKQAEDHEKQLSEMTQQRRDDVSQLEDEKSKVEIQRDDFQARLETEKEKNAALMAELEHYKNVVLSHSFQPSPVREPMATLTQQFPSPPPSSEERLSTSSQSWSVEDTALSPIEQPYSMEVQRSPCVPELPKQNEAAKSKTGMEHTAAKSKSGSRPNAHAVKGAGVIKRGQKEKPKIDSKSTRATDALEDLSSAPSGRIQAVPCQEREVVGGQNEGDRS